MPGLSQEEYLTILRKNLIVEEKNKNKNTLQTFLDVMTKGGDHK